MSGFRFAVAVMSVLFAIAHDIRAATAARELATGAFGFEHMITVPGDPNATYDAMTGDISGWWDHTFSKQPARFFIEPKAGGGFYELFDAQGNGVQHGVVTWAERGKRLRFVGPLGLAGNAVDMVVTWDYAAAGDSTRVKLTCRAAGQIEKGWPELVERVWHHFLDERFKPYVEAKKKNP
ncbi:MAG TPA: SRPBCC domain-containing protein [Candidatus Limnocylindria bacterium]|nr:SRPBCC domain-containing protein [Candidatus Limnocylindria bacterium]